MSLAKLTPATAALNIGSAAPKDDPVKVKEAAKQFEALLIGQMLKSMRDSEGGWMGTGSGDDSAGSAMEYAQEVFAQSLASSGGLGLQNLIVKGFDTPAAPDAAELPE